MNRRHFIQAIGAGLGSAYLAACKTAPPSYRYRLTLTATLNGKSRTGSSVVEEVGAVSAGATPTYARRGEATLVRLDPRRALVALLTGGMAETEWGSDPTPMLLKAYGLDLGSAGHPPDLSSLKQARPPIVLGPSTLPMLVLFRDIGDPASAVVVDPSKPESTLGRDIELKAATIQTTTDDVTTGISTVLPWLADGRNYIDVGQPGSGSIRLMSQDFILGAS